MQSIQGNTQHNEQLLKWLQKLLETMKEFWPSKSKDNPIHEIYNETEDSRKAENRNNFFANIGPFLASKIETANLVYLNTKC